MRTWDATVAATGKAFEVAVVHVFTFENGKVTRYLNFTDSAKVAEAYTKGRLSDFSVFQCRFKYPINVALFYTNT